MLEIRILYDNISIQKGVKPAWGFAALIEYQGKTILFDTGGKADVLLSNMKAMKVSPEAVTDVFISHSHWDHTGGLFGFLSKNHKVKVYVPASFSGAYRDEIKASGAECVGIKDFARIAKDIYSSGELGKEIKEQSLIIDTPKGLIVMTGCAHPGILKIVKEAKKSLENPVLAVLGGFHLSSKKAAETKKIIAEIKRLGVTHVGPCHCTGQTAIKQFQAEFKDGFILIGAGSVIDNRLFFQPTFR
jgi:7,8-dihydropterin-6-yl-methyl-4-(beta-D-ribofuranosyl)aminobenzene 5'-phosphate synthase